MAGRSFPPTSVETTAGVVEASIHTGSISSSYFRTLAIPLVTGRPFAPEDGTAAAPVAIVNQVLAERYWPGENPLGQRIRNDSANEPTWRTVVGMVRDFRYGLQEDPFPVVFVPFAQQPVSWEYLVLKTAVPPGGLVAGARDVVRGIDRDLPLQFVVLQNQIRRSEAVANGRFAITVLGGLALAAGLLAILGVYGVLAYSVTQRRHEIGIRMALGAGGRRVVRDVMGRGLRLAGWGVLLGAAATLAAVRAVESMLFQVSPTDPATLLLVAVLVAVAALAASYLPARRATRIAPVEALRER